MAKGKPKKRKQNGITSLLIKLAVAGASVYLVVSFVSGQLQVSEKQRKLAELDIKLETQTEQNAELERLMESGDEDAYVERMAREKLGYARPDERVFVDISGK